MGVVLMAVGGLVIALGGFLYWGNVSGHFRSFPFAGYITIGIGGAIFAFGRRKQAEEAAIKQLNAPR